MKYSDTFKEKVVYEYLQGPFGYRRLAKNYNIPSKKIIEEWVQAFRAFGKEGLKRKASKTVYPVQFKVDVLHWMKSNSASLSETATRFGLNRPALISSWKHTVMKEGIAGLEPKPKGRPSMAKKPKKDDQTKHEWSREEQLKRENELLRLENSYLKKLRAFRENPDAYLEKHKQRWHSNSKKKDTD
ncbi:helix-turn-helix domain-containing protein [Geomicrobium sediminis]|uniref:Transposase n=1 Tax=Geomicrobium sediminis TaxID=1347788 RepID=A0ABS2PIE6_9BACL|nr:transposase [Geomicrobium sediminis]